MRVVVRQPAGGILERDLGAGSYRVGTDACCEVRLEGTDVAPHHARLDIRADGAASIEDLGSRHGTRVNGDRVVASGVLAPNARVTIGSCELWLGASQSPPSQIGAPVAAPSGRTRFTHQPGRPSGALSFTEVTRRACRRAHEQLIEQLDLRRRDVSALSDPELRALATSILEGILAAASLPEGCDPRAVLRFVLDEALGLGPLEGLLAQEEIGEIMVNGPDDIFVETGGQLERVDLRFSGEAALRGVVERIVAPLGRRVDDASPMVDARLQDGSRVNVIIAPLSLRGTAITIRRFGQQRLRAADLIASGALDASMLQFLAVCVVERRNLLVAGGTGSGKTTLLNILSSLIPRGERVITIEDSAELLFDHPNLVTLETRPANLEGRGEVSVRDLVRNALRMRPDRIVIGECRGGEALDMLQAMNTGHEGSLTTVHANSPRELLSRLEVMVLMSGVDLPVAAVREQIASSIHLIVQQARFACGSRRITRITEVTGIAAGTIQLQDLFRFVPASSPRVPGSPVQGHFEATGHLPQFYESIVQAGGTPDLSLFSPASSGAS